MLLKNYNKLHVEYLSTTNSEVRAVVDRMIRKDQSIRGPKGWFLPQRKMEDVDQKNFLNLKKIVEKNGWPGFTTLGENNSQGKFRCHG